MDVARARARPASSGVDVFGGIALNGRSAASTRTRSTSALKMGGKVVWFPTIASPKHIEHHAEHPNLKFPKLAVDLEPEEPIDVFADGDGASPEVLRDPRSRSPSTTRSSRAGTWRRADHAVFEAAREVGVRGCSSTTPTS
jgi:hypothetical protein